MKPHKSNWVRVSAVFWLFLLSLVPLLAEPTPWDLANRYDHVHRFATLFTAQDVRDQLSSAAGLDRAVAWCQATGVKHVFIEAYRDGYQAQAETLATAKQRFTEAGFAVSGCVTTTGIGKRSTGWESASCMTDPATQQHIKSIFEFSAARFDEIIIDDFFFTDCTCPQCEQGRQAGTVTVEGKVYPTEGKTWEDYRCKLMEEISRNEILAAARAVNPKVKIIIKYPQWYDDFQSRGYCVDTETRLYSRIWVGTETRDYAGTWGGTPQYEGYFNMRWLGGIGGEKCGGGWFDWLGTTEKTYVEQARQTILGGARESFLFCYGGLQSPEGTNDVAALRANLPELFEVARQVSSRSPVGVAAYKPINSAPQDDKKIYDFVGMLGLPLVPCHEFPTNAPSAFFPAQALKDPALAAKLEAFIGQGKPVLISDGLAKELASSLDLKRPNVRILETKGQPASLLNLSQDAIDQIRGPLLVPLKKTFSAPNKVGLYLFSDGSWVIENFNDNAVQTSLSGRTLEIPARGWKLHWQQN